MFQAELGLEFPSKKEMWTPIVVVTLACELGVEFSRDKIGLRERVVCEFGMMVIVKKKETQIATNSQ